MATDQPRNQKRPTRASRPRTKTGCSTCRKRRIKCDESRPSCGACVRSGWKCDGFPASTPSTLSPGTLTPLSISAYDIPFRVPGSKRERELIHYFCAQAAGDLSGFVPSAFWSTTVLQASHAEPIVRQAVLALSSLHLEYVSSDASRSRIASESTAAQYGKALKHLRKRMGDASPQTLRIALICCILFSTFESVLGNSGAALQQLRGGLSLLRSARGGDDGGRLAEPDLIEATFARLDIQATMFDDDTPPTLVLATPGERTKDSPQVPGAFRDSESAQRELVKLQNWLFHFLIRNVSCKFTPAEYLPEELLREKDQLDRHFQRWYDECSSWAAGGRSTDKTTDCAASVLLIQYHVSRMLLASNFPHNDSVFGASPNPLAGDVMDIAEDVLQKTQRQNGSTQSVPGQQRTFSAESGVIAPLALLIMKCADGDVVERATHVLARWQRQEGLYDAASVLSVAQHLTEVRDARAVGSPDDGRIPLSLEFGVSDIIDGAPAGFEVGNTLIPPSIVPTPGLA